jgi:hypothetical protein
MHARQNERDNWLNNRKGLLPIGGSPFLMSQNRKEFHEWTEMTCEWTKMNDKWSKSENDWTETLYEWTENLSEGTKA